MRIHLKGNYQTRKVWLDGKELSPHRSQGYVNHSPDGFNWGYYGSGPAQLALAICLELFDDPYEPIHYQDFKFNYIGKLPQSDFDVEIDIEEVE